MWESIFFGKIRATVQFGRYSTWYIVILLLPFGGDFKENKKKNWYLQ